MALHQVNVEGLQLPEGLYYVLPERLLDLLSELSRKLLDAGQIAREREISVVATQLDCVAFRSGEFVNHALLSENASRVTEEFVSHVNSEDAAEIAEHFNATSEQAHRFGQAYCGWLVSNEELSLIHI